MAQIKVCGFPQGLEASIVEIRSVGQQMTCQEMRSKLCVRNDLDCDLAFVKLDKGYFSGDVCDYSLSQQKEMPLGCLIELKGLHANHAVNQLLRTFEQLRTSGVTVVYKTAVVASRRGSNIPSSEWMKSVKFFKKRGVDLMRKGSNQDAKASELL